MIATEAVIMTADWLKGATAPGKGLNDFLLTVPRIVALDPGAPAPVELIADSERDAIAAEFDTPTKSRAVYLHPEVAPIEVEGEAHNSYRDVPSCIVIARVIVRDPKKAATRRWVGHVTRAIVRSVQAMLAEDEVAHEGRTLASVRITGANRILAGPWYEGVGDAYAMAVVAIDFRVRDTAPRY